MILVTGGAGYIGSHTIVELIKAGEIYPLNNSKYVLFELPFHNQILGLADIVHELEVARYIPILAHPERYSYFQENYELIDKLSPLSSFILSCTESIP